jgi:hypothetical protein
MERWAPLGLVAALLLLLTALTACVADPGETLHIENRTNGTVVVSENGTGSVRISPGETGNFAILKFEGTFTYEVVALDGALLASRTFTWEEIHEEDGITIVVE